MIRPTFYHVLCALLNVSPREPAIMMVYRLFQRAAIQILMVNALLVMGICGLRGQASVVVVLDDPVYRDIDILVAFGMVDEIVFAARPFTRIQVARILVQAEENLAVARGESEGGQNRLEPLASRSSEIREIETILARSTQDFSWELDIAKARGEEEYPGPNLVSRISAGWVMANSRARGIPDNGLGETAASINPLLQNRAGRNLVDGNTLALESRHSVTISRNFAIAFQPRVQLGLVRGNDADVNELVFQHLSGTLSLGNLRLVLGREPVFWGQGRNAGVLFSRNVRGFDMIKLENDRPVELPWILGLLGPTKMSLFVADLGAEQTYPHAKLVAYRMSVKPWRVLELGTGILVQTGGEGAPETPFLRRMQDLFPFVENIFGRTWDVGSNKQAGIDARLTLRGLRGTSIYYEGAIEDIDFSRGKVMFWEGASHIVGLTMPRVTADGRVGVGAEIHRSGIQMYRHNRRTFGLTQDRYNMGNYIGPDAKAAYLFLTLEATNSDYMEVELSVESWNIDRYRYEHPDFLITEIFPTEARYRFVGSWHHRNPGRQLSLGLRFGIERVRNFEFVEDNGRTNVMGEVVFSYEP